MGSDTFIETSYQFEKKTNKQEKEKRRRSTSIAASIHFENPGPLEPQRVSFPQTNEWYETWNLVAYMFIGPKMEINS